MNWHVIPNWVVFAVAVAFYNYAYVVGLPQSTVIEHTIAAVVATICLYLVVLRGSAGAAKLCGAFILWFGIMGGIVFFALSMLLCGLVGMLARQKAMPYAPFAFLVAAVMVGAGQLPQPIASAQSGHQTSASPQHSAQKGS